MSKDKKPAADSGASGGGQCRVEKCGKKEFKMGFCTEHYTWFKEGLINKNGQRPPDFDKKYQNFLQRNKKAA